MLRAHVCNFSNTRFLSRLALAFSFLHSLHALALMNKLMKQSFRLRTCLNIIVVCAWCNGDSEGTTGLLNTTSVNVFGLFDILRPKVAYESEVITALCNICHFLMSESRLLIHKTRFVRLTLNSVSSLLFFYWWLHAPL